MPLRECMETTTNRDYNLWMSYLEEQWNKPSRSDHYLMMVAYYIANVLAKKPKPFNPIKWFIEFTFSGKDKAKPTMSKEEATKHSKARWFSTVFGQGKK